MTKKQTSILIILTSNNGMEDDTKPTGFWFEELATPYFEFVDAGASVELASMKGGSGASRPALFETAGRERRIRRALSR